MAGLVWAWSAPGPRGGALAAGAAGHVLADGCLLDSLDRACRVLGFGDATGGDKVFSQLVPARIIRLVNPANSSRQPAATAASRSRPARMPSPAADPAPDELRQAPEAINYTR